MKTEISLGNGSRRDERNAKKLCGMNSIKRTQNNDLNLISHYLLIDTQRHTSSIS